MTMSLSRQHTRAALMSLSQRWRLTSGVVMFWTRADVARGFGSVRQGRACCAWLSIPDGRLGLLMSEGVPRIVGV